MNKQEIFTKVKNHLLTQMEKSKTSNSCKYRGPDGLMCAVGCLIPDELYDPEMEESFIYGQGFIKKFPEVGKLFDEGTMELLQVLQLIHDRSDVNNWKNLIQQLAIQENLEF